MTVRFLFDEDIDVAIVRGLHSREAAIDALDVKTGGLRAMGDPFLLELAAKQNRIVVTHDSSTMTHHFAERLEAGNTAPGLFVVPQSTRAIGEIIEWLLLVWTASDAEEWCDQIVFGPIR